MVPTLLLDTFDGGFVVVVDGGVVVEVDPGAAVVPTGLFVAVAPFTPIQT